MSYKGVSDFLDDGNDKSLSKCIDNACKPTQLRNIMRDYPAEFKRLKVTLQQLIDLSIVKPANIIREALITLGCEEKKIYDSTAHIEDD